MQKVKTTLAGSLGIASLLTGFASHIVRAEVVTFQNGVDGYTGTFDRRISSSTTSDGNGADVDTDNHTFYIDGGARRSTTPA